MKTPATTKVMTSAPDTAQFTVPSTTDDTHKTGGKFIASAARALKIALLCIVAAAPAACIELIGAQATNCVRCLDV